MKKEQLSGGRQASSPRDGAGASTGLAAAAMRTGEAGRPVQDGVIVKDNLMATANAGYARASHKGTTGMVKGGFEIDGGP